MRSHFRNFPVHDSPNQVRVDCIVVVDQNVSKIVHLAPGNFRVNCPKFRTQLSRRLAQHFEIPADRVQQHMNWEQTRRPGVPRIRSTCHNSRAWGGDKRVDRGTSFLNRPGFGKHAVANVTKTPRSYDIDVDTEQFAEIQAERDQIEQRPVLAELSEHVQVVGLAIIAPRHRTEYAKIACAVLLGKSNDRESLFAGQSVEGDHAPILA